MKFCTEHGSYTAVLCTKFQNDWLKEMCVMGENDIAKYEYQIFFGWISSIAMVPR